MKENLLLVWNERRKVTKIDRRKVTKIDRRKVTKIDRRKVTKIDRRKVTKISVYSPVDYGPLCTPTGRRNLQPLSSGLKWS